VPPGTYNPDTGLPIAPQEALEVKPKSGWPPNTEWYGTWFLLLGDGSY
jgi:hypothetical protein